jgi:hypothetical protein
MSNIASIHSLLLLHLNCNGRVLILGHIFIGFPTPPTTFEVLAAILSGTLMHCALPTQTGHASPDDVRLCCEDAYVPNFT